MRFVLESIRAGSGYEGFDREASGEDCKGWRQNTWVSHYFGGSGVALMRGDDCDVDGGDDVLFPTVVRLYVVSMYWAITTLTTVGYGDVLPISNAEQSGSRRT